MTDFLAIQRQIGASARIRRQVEGPAPTEAAEQILDQIERPTGLGCDQDLLHLSGQVARQHKLPRHPARDGQFLIHLEQALRDLAQRSVEPSPHNDRSRL